MNKYATLAIVILMSMTPVAAAQSLQVIFVLDKDNATANIMNDYQDPNYIKESRILDQLITNPDKTLKMSIHLRFRLLDDTWSTGAIPSISNTKILPVEGNLLPVNTTIIKLPYNAENVRVFLEPISKRYLYGYSSGNYPIALASTAGDLRLVRPYPKADFPLYTVNIYRGIDPATLERTTYLVIRIYPLRLLDKNQVVIYEDIRMDLRYQVREPATKAREDSIDLLIITSRHLSTAAEKLVSLKSREGLRSVVKFVEDIYSEFEGRDSPEKIRNCIRSFVQNYNVIYVIILGDSDVVPVREVYIPDGAYDDDPEIDGKFVETDLYYADLQYSWDDNGDGLWGDLRYDKVDGIPDVLIGRIPASNLTEAIGVIEKIAQYYPASPMYSRVIFAGTDTFQIGYPEGEYLLEFSKNFVRNATIVKLYETLGNLTRATFRVEFDKGAYLIAFTGHGLPDSLALTFSQMYTTGDAYAQINKIYPIFIALSCDAGWFKDIDSLGEALVLNPNGGAIAFLGSTKIAWGYIGELVTTGLMGEIFWRTIKNVFNASVRNLGQVWARTIAEYVAGNPITNVITGYYIDWKTVAEYVLLGDPTLSIVPKTIGNIIDKGNVTIINGSLLVKNETVIIHDLLCDNSTIIVENSIMILDGWVDIANSNITVRNSTILSSMDVYLRNAKANLTDSLMVARLVASNSSLKIYKTVLSSIEIVPGNTLNASNSTFSLVLKAVDSSIELSNLREGFIEYLNLSHIGFDCLVLNSTIALGIISWNGSIYLDNVTITSVYTTKGNVTVRSSIIANIYINSSKASLFASNITVSLVLANFRDLILHELAPGRHDRILAVGDSNITFQDAYVRGWSLLLKNVSIRIENSRLLIIESENSTLTISCANLTFLSILKTSTVVLENVSDLLRVYIAENSELSAQNVKAKNVELNNSVGSISTSFVTVMDLENSKMEVSSSRVECIQAITSEVTIVNSTIVEARISGISNVTLSDSRSAVIDVENSSKLISEKSKILYWLRVYDSANILARDSMIWFGLVYKLENVEIENLKPGDIHYMILVKSGGWSINLSNVYVLGWDILSYDSNIVVKSSILGWIYLFYNSRLSIESSEASLVRVTHDSSVDIVESIIDTIFASGGSKTNAYRSILNTVYVLGNAEINLNSVVFDIVAGLGNAAKARILSSYGGVVAAISGTDIFIDKSVVTIYIAISEENAVIRNLKPGYISSWNSDVLNVDESWRINVVNSHGSWILDLSLGEFTVENSLLSQLYISNATARVKNVIVSDLMGIYGSKLVIYNSKLSSITIIWGSSVAFNETTSIYTYIIESDVFMTKTTANIILGFLEGSYRLKLRPGYYENATLSEFVNASTPIKLTLVNTSITGWYAIGLGIYGRVELEIIESDVISVGIAYNGMLILENSRVYGYSEVHLEGGANVSAIIRNSATRLYLGLSQIEDVVNIDGVGAYKPISLNISKNLRIINTTILEVSIDAYRSNISIRNSKVRTMNLVESEILVEDSRVNEILAERSKVYIASSHIEKARLVLCDATLLNSKVGDFMPYLTEFSIVRSEIGLSIYIIFTEAYAQGVQPTYLYKASAPEDIPLFSRGLFIDTKISRWSFVVGEFSRLELRDSKVHKVDVSSYTSTVIIKSSTVGSVSMRYGGDIVINESKIGLNFSIVNLGLTLRNLGEGSLPKSTTTDIADRAPWNISVSQVEITMLNITVHGALVSLENLSASIILINASSSILMNNSRSLYLIVGGPSDLEISSSFVRLLNPGYGTRLYISKSQVGIVDVFVYGHVELKNILGVTKFYNEQMGYRIDAYASELIDLTILAMMFSNVTVINSQIFTLGADGFSRIWLIDTLLEYPIFAEDLSEIHILYTLTIEVLYDLREPEFAKVTIIGRDSRTYELDAPKGKCKIVLYQGIVREYERLDLGEYEIRASVGGFSASRSIYLWKPMKVTIIILGPFLISLIITILVTVVFVGLLFIKKRKMQKL
ncbi:MAG: C25 family cysteine peptidase [Crenarchaeota archaeon]|nr:C25 family cysteine peptidase [Thermoproteota archaeon]